MPLCECIASICRWTNNFRCIITLWIKVTSSFRTVVTWWTSQTRCLWSAAPFLCILPSWRYCSVLQRSKRRRTRTTMERWFQTDRFREGQKHNRWNGTMHVLGNLRFRTRLCWHRSFTTMHTSGIVGFSQIADHLHLLSQTLRYSKASLTNVLHSVLRLSIRRELPMKARTQMNGTTKCQSHHKQRKQKSGNSFRRTKRQKSYGHRSP